MAIKSQKTLLIKNIGYNFLIQVCLLLLFMITTPIVIHGLGNEAYGILSIVLVIVGYFGFLDLGMTQASVKFLSEHLARGEKKQVYQVVSTSIFTNLVLGVLGGILIALFAPLFAEKIFKVSPSFQDEAKLAFYIFAVGFPAVLIQGTLQAIPTAFQRFDIINIINGIAGTLQALGAMTLVLLGFGLREVVISYLIVRILSASFYLFILHNLLPDFQLRPMWHRPTFVRLIHFGGWVLVSTLVGPLMVNFDRVFIGSLLSVVAVTYYVVPYGMVSKLGIIYGSAMPVLFPAFSERAALPDKASFKSLLLRSTEFLLVTLTPLVLIVIVFAGEILKVWMGADFAQRSAVVAQILAFTILVNGFATIPYTAVQGAGRPDITAKFHLIELPVYIGLCLLLIPLLGINGAALAWAIRATMDVSLLFYFAKKLTSLKLQEIFSNSFKLKFSIVLVFGLSLFLIKTFIFNIAICGALILVSLAFYAIGLWLYGLNETDKSFFIGFKSRLFKRVTQ